MLGPWQHADDFARYAEGLRQAIIDARNPQSAV
jgi:hypothetical protein